VVPQPVVEAVCSSVVVDCILAVVVHSSVQDNLAEDNLAVGDNLAVADSLAVDNLAVEDTLAVDNLAVEDTLAVDSLAVDILAVGIPVAGIHAVVPRLVPM